MSLQSGLRSRMFLGVEGTYGTPVARTRVLKFISESIVQTFDEIRAGDLFQKDPASDETANGNEHVGGDVTISPRYESNGFMLMLEHLFGTVTQSRPDITTAPSVYRYTYTPADVLPTGLTIEVAKHNIAFIHEGCKVSTGRFAFRQGARMEATFGIIGQHTEDGTPPTTGLVPLDGNLIKVTNMAINWGGVTSYIVTEANLNYSNNLAEVFGVDSTQTREPFDAGMREVTGDFTMYFEDVSLWSNFVNEQTKTLTMTLTGASIAGGYSRELLITVPIAKLTAAFPPSNSQGPHMIPATFRALVDAANTNVTTFRLTNTVTAA